MATKPKIELKSIRLHKGLSQETPAYTATLFVDGKKFAEVQNEGHGGPDSVYPPNGTPFNDPTWNKALQDLEARIAATHPKHSYDFGDGRTGEFDESLEVLCHTLVWDDADRKMIQSALKRRIIAVGSDGHLYQWATKFKPTAQNLSVLKAKKPDYKFLNDLPFAEAQRLYLEATAKQSA